MRHHFHRCGNLRVVAVEASDLSGARRGGAQILDELCEARRLAPCVGLVECDVLSAAQKRDLLVARATRLREEEGGLSSVADAPPDPRLLELEALRRRFVDEHRAIVEGNRRLRAEAAAALQRNPRPVVTAGEHALAGGGISTFLDDELSALRVARLDAIERALDALARGRFGGCARCKGEIELERLRLAPDTSVCAACAREALPEAPMPTAEPRRAAPPPARG